MDKNINILQIRIPNYYIKYNKTNVFKKSDKQNSSCYFLNSSNPLKGSLSLKGIKLIKNINYTKKIINKDSHLSPKSKVVIGYLNQYNNNSIYYSSNKKDKIVSKFGENKLNTETKNIKNRIIFTSNRFKNINIKNSIEFQKSKNGIHNKKLIEDSKNNDIIESKDNKYISPYIFFRSNYTGHNSQYLQTCKKPDTTKKKLLNIF